MSSEKARKIFELFKDLPPERQQQISEEMERNARMDNQAELRAEYEAELAALKNAQSGRASVRQIASIKAKFAKRGLDIY